MLLKLIKTRPTEMGYICELWEINHWLGNRLLAVVLVPHEDMPLELIYRLTVTNAGICVQSRPCRWIWAGQRMEILVTHRLLQIQRTQEEIRIEVATPEPDLPGYPHTDYHPSDFYDCELPVGLDAAEDVPDE